MKKFNALFRSGFLLIYFMVVSCSLSAFAANEFNIIPYPQLLIPQQGTFTINSKTVVFCSFQQPEVLKLARQFSTQMALVSGIKLSVRDISGADSTNAIILRKTSTSENVETYRMQVSPKTIHIQALAGNGFFYALQTLYQLLPPEIYGKKLSAHQKWIVPCVSITDNPRFSYRGLHLDVCRHFFPIAFIKKYIDAIAIHKLNKFHWHLTDDQGWRIEIKKYPRLIEIGSKRDETLIGNNDANFPRKFDGKPYGGFYTQQEAKEIVAYAKERYITVIPEIEMPGHAQAAIAAYPYLSCRKDSTFKVVTQLGIFPEVYCPREGTFTFLENVLSEIMEIFPSKYIHIGGDECPKDRWKTCPDCQALIKSKNLKGENGLQSYFVEQIENFLNSKGRMIIGWDEILDGGLATNATVMTWRGINGGIAAAKSGHDVIMTPGTHCYFDHYQADPVSEPMTIGGFTPLSKVYQFEPVPNELNEEQAKHVLGAQANVWAEYIETPQRVEYMAFPRVAAMSEVLWGTKHGRNWDLFRNRMLTQFKRYDQLNINASKAFFDVQFHSSITANKQLLISLVSDYPNVQIHYNTNGKVPTLKDALYKEPIIIDHSLTVTALTFINGAPICKQLSKPFMISKLTGMSFTKNVNNSWYDGGNVNALTDGITGNTKSTNQWMGIAKSMNGEIVVDMQTAKEINRFSVGMLNVPAKCAIISPVVKLFGSVDGINYQLLAEKQIPPLTSPNWKILRPELIFKPVTVRYIKLQLKSSTECLADRENGNLLFMDEIGAW